MDEGKLEGMHFLGAVCLEAADFAHFPAEGQRMALADLAKPGTDKQGVLEGGADGQLEWRLSLTDDVTLSIEGAAGLAKADFMGLSDPFVQVFVGKHLVGETKVIKNTLDPVWDDTVEVRLPHTTAAGEVVAGGELRLEVWDNDLIGTNDFLGAVVFEDVAAAERAAREANGHAAQYPLKALRGRPDDYVKGALRLGLACAKSGNVMLRGLSGDAAAEAAKQTCTVHWQGHVVGQTGPLDGASGQWGELNSFGINI